MKRFLIVWGETEEGVIHEAVIEADSLMDAVNMWRKGEWTWATVLTVEPNADSLEIYEIGRDGEWLQ